MNLVDKAVQLLSDGELVAIPTETVYGLAADGTNESAVKKIFHVKGRPTNNPLILHFSSPDLFAPYVNLSLARDEQLLCDQTHKLKQFFPGPLTLVLPRGDRVADSVCGGDVTVAHSVAVRVPNHPLTLEILSKFGKPVAAPSANSSGYVSPTTAKHVQESLGDQIKLIVDGGACAVGIESTVLSLISDIPTVLRPGSITREQLSAALGVSVLLHSELLGQSHSPLLSPGMLLKHYAPKTRIILTPHFQQRAAETERFGAILFSEFSPFENAAEVRILSKSKNLEEIASNLFSTLRELDALNLSFIVVDVCEAVGLGEAIMDRLIRASK